MLYIPRAVGGRGMKYIETVYKVTKNKIKDSWFNGPDC